MSIDPASREPRLAPSSPPRLGFFTDTSVCIGCKACEVACKEWNHVPEDGLSLTGMSYDNTVGLGADRPGGMWRSSSSAVRRDRAGDRRRRAFSWLMASDVCKHCTQSRLPGRLPDRRAVPHRVRHRGGPGGRLQRLRLLHARPARTGSSTGARSDGRAWKCTLCYDRLGAGLEPACAKACPTDSIQFGPLDELRERARLRVADLRAAGQDQARLYLADPDDGIGGGGAFFLLLDEPEVYGLPPDPVVTTRDLPDMWRHVAIAAAGLGATAVALALGRRR